MAAHCARLSQQACIFSMTLHEDGGIAACGHDPQPLRTRILQCRTYQGCGNATATDGVGHPRMGDDHRAIAAFVFKHCLMTINLEQEVRPVHVVMHGWKHGIGIGHGRCPR